MKQAWVFGDTLSIVTRFSLGCLFLQISVGNVCRELDVLDMWSHAAHSWQRRLACRRQQLIEWRG